MEKQSNVLDCNLSERVYEDHELLVENLLLWTRDSKNKLLFVERPEKTQLFLTPERFLLGPSDRGSSEYDDDSRNILLEEFFSSSNVGVPEVINRDAFDTFDLLRDSLYSTGYLIASSRLVKILRKEKDNALTRLISE